MKLLLIEDSAADARLIREMLKASPLGSNQLDQVTRLGSAVERLHRESFDLVLLDLGLPDAQGINTLLLAQKASGGLPIIVLTGLDDESFAMEAVRAGAQDYLVKGHFDAELLVRTIHYAIERKHAEEEVRRLNAELEQRVAQRTAELQKLNGELLKEVAERERAERGLQQAQARLQAHALELEQTVASRTSRLQETIAELEHFSYAIVHDMRAPLRAMQGFAELIQQDCAHCHSPVSPEYLRRIKTAANRMDKLITDSLAYSRAALQEIALEPVALSQLLAGLVESYPNLQPESADIQIPADLPVVRGNEAGLTQCFSNLLDNAVKFAKAGTKPRIRVRGEVSCPAGSNGRTAGAEKAGTRRGTVRIWVEDSGIGIPKEAQDRIFGLFQRATADAGGTGMGLAIVRKVVERMGGRVGLESDPGQGSRFWLELPLA